MADGVNKPVFLSSPSGAVARMRFSAAEYWRMAQSGAFADMWVELVEGELERMPPPSNVHGRLQAAVLLALGRVVAPDLLRGDTAVRMNEDTVVGGDVLVLHHVVEDDGPLPVDAVALLVEVAVSTADRDLGLKRRLYAAAGVPTYWVVDADRRVVHAFDRPEGGDYKGLALARFGEALTVPGVVGTVAIG